MFKIPKKDIYQLPTKTKEEINSGAFPNSLKASASFSHCGRARTVRNLTHHHHQNPPEPDQASSPEPSGTSSGICTGTFRNLARYPHRNPPGTPPGICTGTLRNLSGIFTRYLHRKLPEHHQASSPEPSGTSPGICIGTFRNLTRYLEPSETSPGIFTRYLDRKLPEPHQASSPEPSRKSAGICNLP